MVKDGYFYGLGFVLVAVVLWTMHIVWLVPIPLLLAMFFLWFFRDPTRAIPGEPGLVVSPADGKVTAAGLVETVNGTRMHLSIFLNVFNVHVNRVPIGGEVVAVEYHEGGYRNAMHPDSATENEQTLITIDNGEYQVGFKQIAGLLARRIVCNVKVGDRVQRGQRMGLIKFGSRTDVLMPADAQLSVKIGDIVKGGSSILGKIPSKAGRPELS